MSELGALRQYDSLGRAGPAKSSCRGHLGLQRRPKVTGSFGHGRPGGLGSSAGCRSSQPGAEQATTQGSGQLLEVFRALEDPAGQIA